MLIIGETFVFVHVPKNGGSSMSAALPGIEPEDGCGHRPFHLTDYGKPGFGFVRNPWDRMVSLWSFMCQKSSSAAGEAKQIKIARDLGFKRWLMEGQFYLGQDRHWMTDNLPPMQRRSQIWWLSGCEYIGRFEDMADDLAFIADALGFEHAPLPHANKSKHGAYQEHYDADSRAFVAEHFAPEIERFGYTF